MKKLAIVQVALGMLIIGSLVYWMGWLSTGYHVYQGTIPGSNNTLGSMGLPAYNPFLNVWKVGFLALGLSVLGCGIVQYIRARGQTAGKWYQLERSDSGRVTKV